ncbi:MFS transporter, DHA2 family, multidrug resistance protein [Noviherbaspirillum suwonense]|uniref:MFS transporter, DHA2 family, multidrug resistance protein n=2 Tax=Noviherbaspirillum suwonense TaxID=1224511 RepID=A0ABY1QBB7_9BURK|nr:MFS transporter, DHA2 family, multidrug resistance protein [Noviherbaspirillum suwonense]
MLSVCIGVGMASLDTAIANTALPAMAEQLHATPAASVWIINIYHLAMVATLLPLAALSEIVGYRRMCIAGVALFTAASLACALSGSLPALVTARLLQGLGASALMSVNGALLRVIYPAHLRGRGFGTNALVVAVGFALGPSVASMILSVWSWPWLFAINVPLGVIAVALGLRVLPRTARHGGRFDVMAAVYTMGAFGLLILALSDAAHLAPLPATLAELALAVLFFVLLLRHEAGKKAPILPTDLFRRPAFALSSLTAVCTFACQSLAFVSLPFYFESVLNRSPIETGFLMTPWAVFVGIMAPIAGRLSDRHSPGLLGGIGLAVLAAGMMSLYFLPLQSTALDISWRMAVCGIGFGFFQAPNLKAIMGSAPPHRSGGASGIIAISRLTGQSIGAALVALCLSLSSLHGASHALLLGALFAALACIASFSRLLVPVLPMD